jgi:hypothetical protein
MIKRRTLDSPTTAVDVSTLTLMPGHVVTVYLHGRTKPVQVELQVDHDGAPHVLLTKEDWQVLGTFDSVYETTPSEGDEAAK